jgi:hypothetical protein
MHRISPLKSTSFVLCGADRCPLCRGRTDFQRIHRHFSVCEGFRMPAHEGGAARTGAGVRKPSQKRSFPTSQPLTQAGHLALSQLSAFLAASFRHDAASPVESQSRKLLVPQSTAAYSAWLISVRPDVRYPRLGSGTYYILLSDRPFVPLQSAPWPSTSPSGQEKVFGGHALRLPGG